MRRQALRLTQQQLAQRIGCAVVTLRKIEWGERRPSMELAELLAKHLKLPVTEHADFIQLARSKFVAQPAPIYRSQREKEAGLPQLSTPVIGRDEDVAAVLKLLHGESGRLTTLTGAGGVGKTCLSLTVAERALPDYSGNVFFVNLASLAEPALVIPTIAQRLGVRELMPSGRPIVQQIIDTLQDKPCLLLLDTFEHVLGAVAEIGTLLGACPNLRVLATSRERLGINGEQVWRVSPLTPQASVELFVACARSVNPRFELGEDASIVETLCQRLDGLPLAIKLVAARVQIMSPRTLLSRVISAQGQVQLRLVADGLTGLPVRQQTLWNTIQWSYDLLSPEEQNIFRRLGVFAGSFDLSAVEGIVSAGSVNEADHSDAVTALWNGLTSLLNKCLIQPVNQAGGEPRFEMLDTLRDFALKQLEQARELDMTRRQHTEYYAGYAEQIMPTFAFQASPDWLDALEHERDNLATAFSIARELRDERLQIRFIAATHPLLMRIPDDQGWLWLSNLFDQPAAKQDPLAYARALYAGALFLGSGGIDPHDARARSQLLKIAADIFADLGNPLWQAASLAGLGSHAWEMGAFDVVEQSCLQSAQLFEQFGQHGLAANALIWLASAYSTQGKYDQGEQLYLKCLAWLEDLPFIIARGVAVYGLGDLEFARGNFNKAEQYLEDANALWQGTMWRELPQRGKGRLALAQGRLTEAQVFFQRCVDDGRWWANANLLSLSLQHLAFVEHLNGRESLATQILLEALNVQQSRLHRWTGAESLERAAWINTNRGRYAPAAQLIGAAEALREHIGAPVPVSDHAYYQSRLEIARTALGAGAFGELKAAGSTMDFAAAMLFARASL